MSLGSLIVLTGVDLFVCVRFICLRFHCLVLYVHECCIIV